MLAKNQVYQVKIIDINNLGFGVCKIDGMSVFVADTVTGDEAEIKIIKAAKTYGVGICTRLITPSQLRVEGGCPASGRCGGCVYQKISYENELALKRKNVEFSLKKAGATGITVGEVLHTGITRGYRNKAQYPVGTSRDGKTVIGFYAAKSHHIIPVSDSHCMLQPEIFTDIVRHTTSFCDRYGISAYDESTGKGCLRHLYLRHAEATGEVMVCLVINASIFPHMEDYIASLTAAFPRVVCICTSENTKQTNVILGDGVTLLYGKPYMEDILCGKRFRISPLAFYQVNRRAAELLYNTAKEMLELQTGETLLDLYCGIGTIGLSVATPETPLIGIEIIPEAIEDAKINAMENGMPHAKFYAGDASDAERILANEHRHADAVIVDPPRKGLTSAVIDYLGKLAPSRIVYISCDPDTLARDIVRFREIGYTTDFVQPVDLFSRTGHCECVTRLRKTTVEHQMKLHAAPFEAIKSGKKTIELRLWDEKRQKIKRGDTVLFTNTENGEQLRATVLHLHRFDSFEALYAVLPLLKCGYTEETISAAQPSDMEQYYSADDIETYGVVEIEISLSEQNETL